MDERLAMYVTGLYDVARQMEVFVAAGRDSAPSRQEVACITRTTAKALDRIGVMLAELNGEVDIQSDGNSAKEE